MWHLAYFVWLPIYTLYSWTLLFIIVGQCTAPQPTLDPTQFCVINSIDNLQLIFCRFISNMMFKVFLKVILSEKVKKAFNPWFYSTCMLNIPIWFKILINLLVWCLQLKCLFINQIQKMSKNLVWKMKDFCCTIPWKKSGLNLCPLPQGLFQSLCKSEVSSKKWCQIFGPLYTSYRVQLE